MHGYHKTISLCVYLLFGVASIMLCNIIHIYILFYLFVLAWSLKFNFFKYSLVFWYFVWITRVINFEMKFKTECGLQTITNLKLQMEFHTGEEFLSSTYLTREFVIFNPCGFKNSCSQRDSDDHSQMIQMWNHELLAYKVKTCPFLSYVKPPTLRLNHAWVEVGHRSVLYKMNCAWKRIVDSIILTLEHLSTGRMIWENFLPMKLRVSGLLVLNGNPSWANHVENGIYTTVVLW